MTTKTQPSDDSLAAAIRLYRRAFFEGRASYYSMRDALRVLLDAWEARGLSIDDPRLGTSTPHRAPDACLVVDDVILTPV